MFERLRSKTIVEFVPAKPKEKEVPEGVPNENSVGSGSDDNHGDTISPDGDSE